MELAITQLEISLAIAETNAPIHEAAGDLAQAALDRNVAASIRAAIEKLKS